MLKWDERVLSQGCTAHVQGSTMVKAVAADTVLGNLLDLGGASSDDHSSGPVRRAAPTRAADETLAEPSAAAAAPAAPGGASRYAPVLSAAGAASSFTSARAPARLSHHLDPRTKPTQHSTFICTSRGI